MIETIKLASAALRTGLSRERSNATNRTELTFHRHWTGPQRILPHFLIVGAQRAGTSSLYANLVQHPLIAPALRKEVHFFDKFFDRGQFWYRGHFITFTEAREIENTHGQSPLTGEATPMYMFNPPAARRMGAMLPDAKLIVMLRNPVDRAYSQFGVVTRRFNLDWTFQQACEEDPIHQAVSIEAAMHSEEPVDYQPDVAPPLLTRGLYVYQLERLYEMYPGERVMVLQAERMFRDQSQVYREIFDFLNLEQHEPESFQEFRAAESEPIPHDTREKLNELFHPHNERLFELIGRRFDW